MQEKTMLQTDLIYMECTRFYVSYSTSIFPQDIGGVWHFFSLEKL